MGDLVYLVRAEDHLGDLDDLPTGPPRHRIDCDLSDWAAGERVDWGAETVGPLTRPRLVALDGGASAPESIAGQTGRPAEDADTDGPGGQQ